MTNKSLDVLNLIKPTLSEAAYLSDIERFPGDYLEVWRKEIKVGPKAKVIILAAVRRDAFSIRKNEFIYSVTTNIIDDKGKDQGGNIVLNNYSDSFDKAVKELESIKVK